MKNIILDLDNTTFDYSKPLHKVGVELGTIAPGAFKSPTTYNMIEDGWFSSREDFFATHEVLCSQGGMATLPKLDSDCTDSLVKHWKSRGYNTLVVTARKMSNHSDELNDYIAQQTYESIKTHIPSIEDIIIVESDKTQIEGDFYLDDSPSEIDRIINAGRKVIVRDMPYNRDRVGFGRVNSLARVNDYL